MPGGSKTVLARRKATHRTSALAKLCTLGRTLHNCRSHKSWIAPPEIPMSSPRYESIAVSLGKRLPLACCFNSLSTIATTWDACEV